MPSTRKLRRDAERQRVAPDHVLDHVVGGGLVEAAGSRAASASAGSPAASARRRRRSASRAGRSLGCGTTVELADDTRQSFENHASSSSRVAPTRINAQVEGRSFRGERMGPELAAAASGCERGERDVAAARAGRLERASEPRGRRGELAMRRRGTRSTPAARGRARATASPPAARAATAAAASARHAGDAAPRRRRRSASTQAAIGLPGRGAAKRGTARDQRARVGRPAGPHRHQRRAPSGSASGATRAAALGRRGVELAARRPSTRPRRRRRCRAPARSHGGPGPRACARWARRGAGRDRPARRRRSAGGQARAPARRPSRRRTSRARAWLPSGRAQRAAVDRDRERAARAAALSAPSSVGESARGGARNGDGARVGAPGSTARGPAIDRHDDGRRALEHRVLAGQDELARARSTRAVMRRGRSRLTRPRPPRPGWRCDHARSRRAPGHRARRPRPRRPASVSTLTCGPASIVTHAVRAGRAQLAHRGDERRASPGGSRRSPAATRARRRAW